MYAVCHEKGREGKGREGKDKHANKICFQMITEKQHWCFCWKKMSPSFAVIVGLREQSLSGNVIFYSEWNSEFISPNHVPWSKIQNAWQKQWFTEVLYIQCMSYDNLESSFISLYSFWVYTLDNFWSHLVLCKYWLNHIVERDFIKWTFSFWQTSIKWGIFESSSKLI